MVSLAIEIIGCIVLHIVFTVIGNSIIIVIVPKNKLVGINIEHKKIFIIIRCRI
ncbi:hypothetical protein ES708_27378 [subsurface metagenome]